MKPRHALGLAGNRTVASSSEPCSFASFDSVVLTHLQNELAASRALERALRARLEVAARLLEAERAVVA